MPKGKEKEKEMVNYVKAALNKALEGVPQNVANEVRGYHATQIAMRKAKGEITFENQLNLQKKYPKAVAYSEGKYKKGGKGNTRKAKRHSTTRRNRLHTSLSRRHH